MQVVLSEISARAPEGMEKAQMKTETNVLTQRLSKLQNLLFAQNKYSVLLVLQGMDASGKDGVIKEIFSNVNPLGCRVHPFKKPTEPEFSHDFLWRIHQAVPAKGMIEIFNRSHYEDVLIQRVHHWIDEKRVYQRYKHINNFESLLMEENNTVILKYYLHVSHQKQLKRLKKRKNVRRKMWKWNPNDLVESKLWAEYMQAYQDVFEHCSEAIPWHIVPSDQKWYKEYLIAKTLVDKLESLNMEYPSLEE